MGAPPLSRAHRRAGEVGAYQLTATAVESGTQLPLMLMPDAAAIPLQAKVLGEDAEDTLASRNNLGLAAQRSGKFAEAEQILRDVLQRCRRVSGARHPETLRGRTSEWAPRPSASRAGW